jgi:hypothetical protein
MSLFYKWTVKLLKNPIINHYWKSWKLRRGEEVGNYDRLPEYIREHASGHSFADIGCMWGVNGEYSFIAEEAGATEVKAIDVFGPTPEFEAKKQQRNSSVEFILGDATDPDTIARIGIVDVVFCAGVLYHHPSPFDVLVALRRMCGKILILRTATIPEIKGLKNVAVFYPMLKFEDRKLWDLRGLGLDKQVGLTDGFEPHQGYGNWFWGITPSCLKSLLETAGFQIDYWATEAFAQTCICSRVDISFYHRLPNETEAREIGKEISKAGIARPA